jgi:hypothetical protein
VHALTFAHHTQAVLRLSAASTVGSACFWCNSLLPEAALV